MGSTRTPIPHSHRVALRQHFQTTNPKPTQAALRAWFTTRFGYKISQSVVSRSLSDSFANLDSSEISISAYRTRNCQWPWLESLLADWLQDEENRSGKVANDVIRKKAKQLWEQADESRGLVMPQFSEGWAVKFMRRYSLRLQSGPDQHPSGAYPDKVSASDHFESGDINPEHAFVLLPPRSETTGALSSKSVFSTFCTNLDSEQFDPSILTFSSDHLIHLIQQNVYRALMSNKSLLCSGTLLLKECTFPTPIEQFPTQICGGLTIVRPLPDRQVPDTLYPTSLQMNCLHTGWINMFPFPRFRDNLIKKGVDFIPEEMCKDLFGDIFRDITYTPRENVRTTQERDLALPIVSADVDEFEDQDDFTAGRKCFINWGDPSRIESWEVTPGFLKNWGWALEGCEDLIQASNRWRAVRNEKLIKYA